MRKNLFNIAVATVIVSTLFTSSTVYGGELDTDEIIYIQEETEEVEEEKIEEEIIEEEKIEEEKVEEEKVEEEIGEPIKIHKNSNKIKNSKKDEKDSGGSEEDLDIIGIVPYFINIMTCRNDLDLEDIGNYAQVYAATEVYPGNYAGVKIELQQMYPYGWRTIKTWDKWEKTDYFSVEANWVVSRSFQYRTKNTHTARTSTGAITDTAISYSYILAF